MGAEECAHETVSGGNRHNAAGVGEGEEMESSRTWLGCG